MADMPNPNDELPRGKEYSTNTIFANQEKFNPHLLKNTWVLWFDNQSNQKNKPSQKWEDSLELIYKIKSIEDMWGVYNNAKTPQDIPKMSNYHLFKEGIKPMWEDPRNAKGGKWTLVLTGPARQEGNKLWLRTIMLLLGEQLTDGDNEQVCGAVFSARHKNDKISLWTKDALDTEGCNRIGRTLKQAMGVPPGVELSYAGHQDAMSHGSSYIGGVMKV
eukprot:m.334276 g.334276  ORF g.334276 m.334276 type:complete len:218 (-) comp17324_c0_seq1:968-1621(-)